MHQVFLGSGRMMAKHQGSNLPDHRALLERTSQQEPVPQRFLVWRAVQSQFFLEAEWACRAIVLLV